MDDLYRQEHEAFMSGSKGTSVSEIMYLSLLTPVWSLTVSVITFGLKSVLKLRSYWLSGILEACFLSFPLISAITFMSDHIPTVLLLVICSFILCCLFLSFGHRTTSIGKHERSSSCNLDFISCYRSQLFLDTSISILAVDFPIYPRRLAKTDLYGFGYMDVGVGCFIFAAGIVSNEARAISMSSRLKCIKAAVRSSSLMVLLGLIRAVSTWATNYHVQVSEYGIHWNFFLTLAAVRIICTSLLSIISMPILTIFAGTGCVIYQWMLTHHKLTDFVLDEHREGIIEQNKEGLLSLVGYCFLYLVATFIGKTIFSSKSRKRMIFMLISLGLISFFTMSCCHCIAQRTSRRLLNVSYILWMVFFNCFHLTVYLIRDTVLPRNLTNVLLSAINKNAIFHFLLANLMTGAINMTVDTIHASPYMSIFIIVLYNTCLSFTVLYLHKNNLKVDFLGLKIKKN